MSELFEADVNYLAVALAAIACQPLGFLWYGKLFYAPWTKQRNLTADDAEGAGATEYLMPLVCAAIIAYGMARLVDMTGADSVGDCLAIAAFVWISFAGTVQAMQITFSPKVPNKIALFGIEGGFQLACFLIIGAIIGAFQ